MTSGPFYQSPCFFPCFSCPFTARAEEVAAAGAVRALLSWRPRWRAATNQVQLIGLGLVPPVADCFAFGPDLVPDPSVSCSAIDREFCEPGRPPGRSAQLSNTGRDRF